MNPGSVAQLHLLTVQPLCSRLECVAMDVIGVAPLQNEWEIERERERE